MYTNEFQTVEYQGSILLGEGGGEDLSPKLSSFPPPPKKLQMNYYFQSLEYQDAQSGSDLVSICLYTELN